MKPLRGLAKGYQYMKDVDGNSWVVFLAPPSTTPTTAILWSYGAAPAECFADTKPEPPREGERVVVADEPGGESCPADRKYAKKHGAVDNVGTVIATVQIDGGPMWAFWLRDLRHEREDERPAEKRPEPLRANFPPPQYHGGLPVLPIAEKEPEPVIGCKLLRADGGSLIGKAGRRLLYPVGETVEDNKSVGVFVAVEGGLESACATQKSGDFVAALECWDETSKKWWGRDRRTLDGQVLPSGVTTYRRVRRLPEIPMDRLHPDLRKEVEAWQAKQEPPPRKFADGQWVEWGVNRVRVKSAHYIKPSWEYILDGCFHHPQEEELTPCPPPLSEAQRRLLPGDKVRGREKRWDEDGKPLSEEGIEGVFVIYVLWMEKGIIRAELRNEGCVRRTFDWLHNLDPAEEK